MPSTKETLSARLRRHRRQLDALLALFWVAVFLVPYGAEYEVHRILQTGKPPGPVLSVLASTIGPLRSLDDYYADVLARHGRLTATNPDIVFLGIDDASERVLDDMDPEVVKNDPALSKMANFPWPREVYGLIYDRLVQSGARLVLFDVLFQQPKPINDAQFKAALDRNPDRFVLSCNFVPQPQPLPETLTLLSDSLIPQTSPPDSRIAFVNFWPDIDNTIRAARYHRSYAGAAIGQVNSSWVIDSMAGNGLPHPEAR